jgi:hypothetical protein
MDLRVARASAKMRICATHVGGDELRDQCTNLRDHSDQKGTWHPKVEGLPPAHIKWLISVKIGVGSLSILDDISKMARLLFLKKCSLDLLNYVSLDAPMTIFQ